MKNEKTYKVIFDWEELGNISFRKSATRLFAILILFLSIGRAEAQYVSVPDTNFRNYLITNFPTCMSGNLLDTSRAAADTSAAYFHADYMNIVSFEGMQYFKLISDFSCRHNPTTFIPSFPDSMYKLFVRETNLTSLPPLPHKVSSYLGISYSPIQRIDSLPLSCPTIDIQFTSLTSLPPFPQNGVTINVGDNYLTAVPDLPPLSIYFGCQHEPVRCLPNLPASLVTLDVFGTYINCLPPHSQTLTADSFVSNLQSLPTCDSNYVCGSYNIVGRVFWDMNGNCVFDSGDVALPNIAITIDSGLTYSNTGLNRLYYVLLDSGRHIIAPYLPFSSYSSPCVSIPLNFSSPGYSGTDTINFPLYPADTCSYVIVDITTHKQQLCTDGNYYSVAYANLGNLQINNAQVIVTFDPAVTPIGGTLLWSSQVNNTYTYNIGSLLPGQTGTFTIFDSVACNATIGQTACVSAIMTPQNLCQLPSVGWDSSSITVSDSINPAGDSVICKIHNSGHHNMTHFTYARVYEDELLMSTDTFTLLAGQTLYLPWHLNGKTIRFEVDQVTNHPGRSRPRTFCELHGTPPYTIHQIIPVPQDDLDDWIQIDCHEIVAAFDPNSKDVFPTGVGIDRWVTAQDDLEYVIQFQNTGTAAATKVVLVDTLDNAHLDIKTIVPGAGSARYQFSLEGNGIAKWTFNNIMLPDSHSNQLQSHGYVKFTVRQKATNQPGTRINNFADIYFDHNTPVRTNTPFVTIELKENIFTLGVKDITSVNDRYKVSAYPNPFGDVIAFSIVSDQGPKNYTIMISDLMGRDVYSREVTDAFVIGRAGLTQGIYIYKITSGDQLIGTGKIIAR